MLTDQRIEEKPVQAGLAFALFHGGLPTSNVEEKVSLRFICHVSICETESLNGNKSKEELKVRRADLSLLLSKGSKTEFRSLKCFFLQIPENPGRLRKLPWTRQLPIWR